MKDRITKLGNILKTVYGYGIMVCLFAGGAVFFGYLFALLIGGDLAMTICDVIKIEIVPVIIYISSIFVVIGLISMYLCGEIALSVNDKRKK